MSRDSTIACVAAISFHALVLFGLPAREKPPVEMPEEFVEVALVEAPRMGQPVAAPAPNPQPEAPTPTPPPQPEIKPEPEPEPPPEPAPVIPEPTPEHVTIPAEPTPPVQAQPQTTAVAQNTTATSTAGPAGPTNSKTGPIGTVGTPDGTGEEIPEGAAVELRKATISYPVEAKRLKQQGTVEVRIQVSLPGRPDKVEVIKSSGFPLLDEAAIEAASRSRYRPAYKGNRPIPSVFTKPYTFKLE